MKRRILLWVCAVVGVWLLAAVLAGIVATFSALSGRDAVEVVLRDPSFEKLRSEETAPQLIEAANEIGRAHDIVASPLYWPVRPLPWFGTQLHSAISMTDTAERASRAVAKVSEESRTLTTRSGQDRVAQFRTVSDICSEGAKTLESADAGPRKGLVGPLADAREKVDRNLHRLRTSLARGAAASAAFGDLLGRDSNYLMIAANNAEMRAGSGTFLSVGLLSTKDGKIDVGDMQTVADVTALGIPLPSQYQDNWGWIGATASFPRLMLSPRFDASAPLAKSIWERSGRPAVDGVIVMDIPLLQAMLRATGPVTVGNQELDANNVERILFFEQYANVIAGNASTNQQRRDSLAEVAKAVFSALNNGNVEVLKAAKELAQAADGRHLLVWSSDTQWNDNWKQAGVGGEVANDATMLNVVNIGNNKLDQFLNVTSNMTTEVVGDKRRTNIKIALENKAPAGGPQYVVGPNLPNLKAGDYVGVLAMTLPGDVSNVEWANNANVVVNGDDANTFQTGARFEMAAGGKLNLELSFSRPLTAGSTIVLPSARVPSVTWRYNNVIWKDTSARTLRY